jgi:hypothetical protein
MIKNGFLASLFCSFLCVSGCAQHLSMVSDTAKLAIMGQPDAEISTQKVAEIPYSSAFLKVGKAPRAFVVLGFAEQGNLKWLSADKNMVVMRAGRLIKTSGFCEDILYTDNLMQDPLALGLLKTSTPMKWQHRVEWSQVYRGGYDLRAEFEYKGIESISILGKDKKLKRFDETVTVPALNTGYTNRFWLDPVSGQVIQSYQYMGPNLALVQFTVLKPYAE